MFKRLVFVLVAIHAISFAGASGVAQEAKPASDSQPGARRLDEKAWTDAFSRRFREIPEQTDPAGDAELVRLVTTHPWHAVLVTSTLLDRAAPVLEKPRNWKETVRLARSVAVMLHRESGLRGMLETLEAVESWRMEEWRDYRRAWRIYNKGLDALQKPDKLAEAGKALVEAAQLFARVRRPYRAAATNVDLARCRLKLGSLHEAESVAKMAISVLERYGDTRETAHALAVLSSIQGGQNRTASALQAGQEALRLRREIGVDADIAESLNDVGICFSNLGRFDEALSCFHQALALKKNRPDPADTATTLVNIGSVLARQEKREEALRYFSRAETVLRDTISGKPSRDRMNQLAHLLINLVQLYSELGKHQEANSREREAEVLLEKLGDVSLLALHFHNSAYRLGKKGNHGGALEYARKARAFWKRIGNKQREKQAAAAAFRFSLKAMVSVIRKTPAGRKCTDPAFIRLIEDDLGQSISTAVFICENPEVFAGTLQESAEILERTAFAVAAVLADRGHGGLLATLERVKTWSEEDCRAFRTALKRVDSAQAQENAGHYDKAVEQLDLAVRTLDTLGHHHQLSRCLVHMAHLLFRCGRYREAIATWQRGYAIKKQFGDPRALAVTENDLGVCWKHLGKYDQAAQWIGLAIDHARAAADAFMMADAMLNLGGAMREAGRYREAGTWYSRAEVANRELRSDHIQSGIHLGRGTLLECSGDLEQALARYQEGLPLARRMGKKKLIGFYLNNIGGVYSKLGMPETAEAHYRESLSHREHDREVALTWENIAALRIEAGRNDDALEALKKALRIRRKLGNLRYVGRILVSLGTLLAESGKQRRALDAMRKARAALHDTGTPQDLAYLHDVMGELHSRAEDWDAAAGAIREARRSLRGAPQTSEDAERTLKLMAALAASGRWDQARVELEKGLDAIRRVGLVRKSERERITHAAGWHRFLGVALDVALNSPSRRKEKGGGASLAFRTIESLQGIATAHTLGDSLAGAIVRRHPEFGDRYHEVSRQMKFIDEAVLELVGKTGPEDDSRRRDLENRRRVLADRWEDIRAKLAVSSPDMAEMSRPDPPSLEHFQATLSADMAYVALVLDSPKSFLVLVDRNGLRQWHLPGRDVITGAVTRHLMQLLVPPGTADLGCVIESGKELFELLLKPAYHFLSRYETWLLVLDQSIAMLPFHTIVRPGPGNDICKAPYLVRDHNLIYIHSGTVWRLMCSRVARRKSRFRRGDEIRPTRVLVLGDPVCPEEKPSETAVCREFVYALRRGSEMGRLAHTRREAFAILEATQGAMTYATHPAMWRLAIDGEDVSTDRFSAEVTRAAALSAEVRNVTIRGPQVDLRLGVAASKKGLFDGNQPLEGYRFLHIASHALVRADRPELTGLLLSPSEYDLGFLRLMDVMALRLRAELVVLSGCKTAMGKPMAGEGFRGLARTFLLAGAENVIAAAWVVPDETTAELLPGVYKSLVDEELSPVEAVRHAMIRYLERVPPSTPEKAHPHYWGAWMLWGTGVEVK